MDLLKIDQRIEKNLERLEASLSEYEEKIREAADLKEYFGNQTIGLRNAYKKRLNQLEEEFKVDKEKLSSNIQDFNGLYKKIVILFEELDAEKKEFTLLKNKFNEEIERKWETLERENKKALSNLEKIITDRINALEKIINEKIAELRSANSKNAEDLFALKQQFKHNNENVVVKLSRFLKIK